MFKATLEPWNENDNDEEVPAYVDDKTRAAL
jgi:hypothetical protein